MSIKANESFAKALEKFAEKGARRILLLKPKEVKYQAVSSPDVKVETDDEQDSRKKKISEIVGIISQADVVKFIYEHVFKSFCHFY
jgi:CBS domain-containing protein